MGKYRKKPVVIEAVQYPCEHPALKSCGCAEYVAARPGENIGVSCTNCGHGFIETLEGQMRVSPGDWIITGVQGEHYPCKPDIFAATYEAADDASVQSAGGMSFGQATDAMRAGHRVCRAGWNGKGMFVYLVPPASYPVQTGAAKAHFGEGSLVPYNAYFAIKNVDDTVSTWVPSVNDCLASDWQIIGEPHTPALLTEADAAADLAGTPRPDFHGDVVQRAAEDYQADPCPIKAYRDALAAHKAAMGAVKAARCALDDANGKGREAEQALGNAHDAMLRFIEAGGA